MASVIDFIVKVKDMMSAPMAQIAQRGSRSFASLETSVGRFTNRMSGLSMSIRDIDRKMNDLRRTREISLDSRQIRRINQELSELERRKARLEGGGAAGGGSMLGLGGMLGGALALGGVAGIGGAISMGMEQQMAAKSFEVMTGDKAVGQKLTSNITQFAQESIYGNELMGNAKTMLAFGIDAKAIMPALSKIGDIAGGDAQKLNSLSLAFSQVAASGKLTGGDLLQFVNAGFNPLQEISVATGKSMGVLRDEMSKGKISFADVAGAIDRATGKGGKFFQMTKQIGETGPGKLLALQGAFQGFAAKAGSAILDLLVPLIEFGQWLLDTPSALYGIATALGALVIGIGVFNVVTNWAAISAWALNLALMWPVLAIAVLVGAIVALVMYFDGWGKAMENLWMFIKLWSANIGILFGQAFDYIGYHVSRGMLQLKGFAQYLEELMARVGSALSLASRGMFSEAKAMLTAKITTDADREITALDARYKSEKAKSDATYAFNKSSATALMGNGLFGLTVSKSGKKATEDFGKMSLTDLISGGKGGAADKSGAEASAKGITGGGVRNLTINVAKFFEDLNFQSATVSEGVQDVEDKMTDMFLRVVNSANAAVGQ